MRLKMGDKVCVAWEDWQSDNPPRPGERLDDDPDSAAMWAHLGEALRCIVYAYEVIEPLRKEVMSGGASRERRRQYAASNRCGDLAVDLGKMVVNARVMDDHSVRLARVEAALAAIHEDSDG